MAQQSRIVTEQGRNTLVPIMQEILSCLDVQLEEELIRYRRHKSKQAQAQRSGGQKENRLAALEIIGFKPNRFRQSAATTPTPVFSPSPTVSPSLTALPLKDTAPETALDTAQDPAFSLPTSPQTTHLVVPTDLPPIPERYSQEPYSQNDRSLSVNASVHSSLISGSVPLPDTHPVKNTNPPGDRVSLDMAAFDPIEQRFDQRIEQRSDSVQNPVYKPVYAVEDTYQLAPIAWDNPLPFSRSADLLDGTLANTSPTIAPATFTIETSPVLTPVVWPQNTLEPAGLEPNGQESAVQEPTVTQNLGTQASGELFIELPAELSEAELLALNSPVPSPIPTEPSPLHASFDAPPVSPIEADPDVNPAFEAWAIDAFLEEDNPWPDHLDEDPRTDIDSFAEDSFSEDLLPEDPLPEGAADWTGSDSEEPEPLSPPLSSLSSPELSLPEEKNDVTPEDSLPLALPASTLPHPGQLGFASRFAKPGAPPGVTRLVAVGTQSPQGLKPISMGNLAGLNPEGYLASSEALLDHLEEEEEGSGTWIKNLNNLFTPLGLGSALLLLVSALAVSVVLLNPELVSHWGLKSPWSKPAETPVLPDQPPEAPTIDSTDTKPLSSQEFLDLDLGNLRKANPLPENGSLEPINGVTPSSLGLNESLTEPGTVSDPSADESGLLSDFRDSINGDSINGSGRESENLDAPLPSEEYLEEPNEDRVEEAPPPRLEPARQPAKAPSPPKPVDRPAPSILESDSGSSAPLSPSLSPRGYSVVTPYTSDQLLDQAQTIVPDAYLKNTEEGANIQFGVFNDPESAAALVEQLREEGIPVQVVPSN